MAIVFSPSTGNFYADDLRDAYDKAGTWPSDGVPVSDDTWQTFIGKPPDGKVRGAVNGAPGWVNAPAAPPTPKPQSITPTQFLNRIPPAVLPVLWGSPQTGIMLITLAAASMIDLTDPNVAAGINNLVPSVLTAAQASAILDH
jgi:hypothetical protein